MSVKWNDPVGWKEPTTWRAPLATETETSAQRYLRERDEREMKK